MPNQDGTPTNWVDPMDQVIQQLQPAEGSSPVIPNPEIPLGQQPGFIPEHPVEQPIPQPQPQSQPEPPQPVDPNAGEKLIAEIDALLNEIETEPKAEPVKPEVAVELVSPKALENLDNEKLSIDEKQEIINYVSELETQVAENDFNYKTVKIERDQLEHMLEKERAKNNEVFDKFKELERENKKVKAGSMPDDLHSLVDFYKLNKENSTLYNKRNLVGEACKIIEQITEVKMDDYLMTWLKSGSYFAQDAGGSSLDLPPAQAAKAKAIDDFNILSF